MYRQVPSIDVPWMFKNPLFPQVLKSHIYEFAEGFVKQAESFVKFQKACQQTVHTGVDHVFHVHWGIPPEDVSYVFDRLLDSVQIALHLRNLVADALDAIHYQVTYWQERVSDLDDEIDCYYKDYEETGDGYYEHLACQSEYAKEDDLYELWRYQKQQKFLKVANDYFDSCVLQTLHSSREFPVLAENE
jgi:hypothetical protein